MQRQQPPGNQNTGQRTPRAREGATQCGTEFRLQDNQGRHGEPEAVAQT